MTNNPKSKRPLNFYQALPKVELHRHLEGSLRLRTLMEIGRAHGISLPNTNKLRELVQIGEEDYSFENFLSKFQTLRLFYRSPEVIERVTMETFEDAARDNVKYMELRFTPVALGRLENYALGQVIDWVIDGTKKAEKAYGIKTRLIASVNRHESAEIAMQVVDLAIERQDQGIVGLDLAGNEADFDGLNFLGAFKKAKNAGLKITIHAGEWGPAENITRAINYLGADRIGHGVRVLEDPGATSLARVRGTPFEVCVTSNYQSGVVPELSVHPLTRMIDQGLCTTINTDDPSISQITLSDEYHLICEDLGVSLSSLRQLILDAANSSFLPADEKAVLVESIGSEFDTLI